jgi:hypothetical protein
MATTWAIEQLNRELSDGLVTTARWRCTVSDDVYSINTNGSVGLDRGDSFTPYEDLTEEQVLVWVKEKLNTAEIEDGLQSHIDGLKNPVSAAGVPWL